MIGKLLAVFGGGCLGGLARYAVVTSWSAADDAFPWAVLVINCSGALLLGALLTTVPPARERLRALVGTGFCGAWTTFSAITVTADQLINDGHVGLGLAYVLASAAGGLLAAGLGIALCRRVRPC